MKTQIKYVMDSTDEIERLEKQASIPAYQAEQELQSLPHSNWNRILDAGCGTGVVTRRLAALYPNSKVEGCDLSEDRLGHARKASGHRQITYFQTDLEQIPAQADTYDLLVSRYVFEHLATPDRVARELFRVLKPGGLARIIDFDGMLLNMHPRSSELTRMLELLLKHLPLDLYVGRRLPDILSKAGFENITWEVGVHGFQGDDLKAEKNNIAERITGANPVVKQVLGSEIEARRFEKLFLKELDAPQVVLFYNKFIVDGRKPRSQ